MNILFGSESYFPSISGVTVVVHRLARELTRRGHRIAIATTSPSLRTYTTEEHQIRIVRVRSLPNPFRKKFRFSPTPRSVLSKTIAQEKPDVIHVHDPALISSTLIRLGKAHHIPLVITHHFAMDLVLAYFKHTGFLKPAVRRFLMHRMRALYNQCTFITCPTETIKKEVSIVGSITPIRVISNGIDLQRFKRPSSLVPQKSKTPSLPTVVYVGRIDPEKQIEVLYNTAVSILSHTKAKFLFCGGGNQLERYRARVKEKKLEQHIIFTGPLAHDDPALIRHYLTSALFWIASPVETQSLVTMEAMAAGLPIVAADAGALPELVKDGVNGYLVPVGNVQAFVAKTIQLLQDEKKRHAMGEASRRFIKAHSMEHTIDVFEKLYQEAIGHNP